MDKGINPETPSRMRNAIKFAQQNHNQERSCERQILQLFFDCDQFCCDFLPQLAARQLDDGKPHRQRSSSLSVSEVMTIVVLFHHSGSRDFKTCHTQHVCQQWPREFPQLVSSQRFVELKPSALIPLAAFLHSRFGIQV
jgi:hypothetical protein